MIPENLIFLSAQPIDQYFTWQVEVQIVNFRKFGISDKMHILIWYPEVREWELVKWYKIQEKYPEVKFFYYKDYGVNLSLYIPQLRPHILKQHFKKYESELKEKVFFYHDSDIIFNYLPDFEELVKDDICWQSNCSGYLDYKYLRNKEEQGNIPEHEAIQLLADIGNITIDTIKEYTGKTGGAQCILKNIDYTFWEDVERMCLDIRNSFSHHKVGSINNKYFSSESAGFQSWCADMWAVNFSLWKRSIETNVTSKLDFSWATDSLDRYNKCPIFHNAGVSSSGSGLFYKGEWINKSPIKIDFPIPPENTASYMYCQAILAVREVT